MPQITHCPHCQKALQVPQGAAGKPMRCPFCKQVFALRQTPAARVGVLADQEKPAAKQASAAGSQAAQAAVADPPRPRTPMPPPKSHWECPACKAKLRPSDLVCGECGYLLQKDPVGIESEAAPNLCPNPACGVANQIYDRTCKRCGTPIPLNPGTLLHGRYRIEKDIATGGFGIVYLASDIKQNDLAVAIKYMIAAEPSEYPIRLSFFQREAEILRLLEDLPIVPKVYDFVRQGQSVFLVLEFIKGQDLLKLMESRKNQPFSFEQVVEWGKSICDVLSHMHKQTPPLVHRDLKPDNIMLLEDQRSIKMIDFGTARDLGRSDRTRQLAKTRVFTEGYAPPEQIIGKPEARSDLFALAGTLYHLATGKGPEGFYTARELEKRLNDPACPIPQAQRWFFELLKINLAEDVNERYFTSQEFKADLEGRRVTKEVACPKCRAINKVRHPYCEKCAAALTDLTHPCQCGKQNRMGSRYCIYCGQRLR